MSSSQETHTPETTVDQNGLTDATRVDQAKAEGRKPDVEEIRADIADAREELAETVDALGAKMDVKGRTKRRIGETRDNAQAKVNDLTARAKDAATDEQGQPKPEVSAGAAGVALLVVGIVVLIVWRRRR